MLLRLLQLFLFLLPLHGAIVVFGFEGIRYWKEVFLGIFVLVWAWEEGRVFLSKKSVHVSREILLGVLFLVWIGILISLNEDIGTALLAARYLGLGMGVYLLFSRMFALSVLRKKDIKDMSKAFVYGLLVSVGFGVWAHFLGGYEVLSNWYSSTISSWVPGQTIPLYHETGGLVRMQGASSGPVEFAHLLLIGVVALFSSSFSKKWSRVILTLFLVGIAFSLTRAVWLALLMGVVIWFFQQKSVIIQRWIPHYKGLTTRSVLVVSVIIIVLVGSFLSVSSVRNHLLHRAGTSDHITRPIEALGKGLEHPFVGNLGGLGPAARAQNMALHNDDKAPIAENVFIDVFAQTGLMGILLYLSFFFVVWKKLWKQYAYWVVGSLVVLNIATVFDMTPVSISYFMFMVLLGLKGGAFSGSK